MKQQTLLEIECNYISDLIFSRVNKIKNEKKKEKKS